MEGPETRPKSPRTVLASKVVGKREINLRLAILLPLAASLAYAQGIPVALQRVLQRQPGLKVLDAPIEPDLLDSMKEYKCWPPWSEVDLDGDGRKDIVAVVVKGSPPNRAYGVLAIHARAPPTIHWVVPLGKDSITGLSVDQPAAAVVPLYCFDCDSNPFYRWSGTGYEQSLFRVGEKIALFFYEERNEAAAVNLYVASSRNSKIVASRPSCTRGSVLDRRGTSENRWYQIETADPDRVRGWVPGSTVVWMDCLGVLHD